MIKVFGKKDPLRANFQKKYERIHHITEPRFVCKFRKIWLTWNRQRRALFTWQKKNKTSASSPALASVWIAPKICQVQLQTIYSESPKFHPNPFTSSGVIDERMKIAETRHKVFPILAEASSPSKTDAKMAICAALHNFVGLYLCN